jgi:RecJ-like exonuclease
LLRDLQEQAEPGMTVFILDVAINETQKEQIFKRMRELAEKGEVIYIDHHPLPPDTLKKDLPVTRLVHSVGTSTSALTFRFLQADLDPDFDRVALWGAIADYTEGAELARNGLSKYDRRTIYMEAGLLSQALGEASGDYHYKREVAQKLSQGLPPSEIPEMVNYAMKATKREWEVWRYVKENVKREDNIAIIRHLPSGSLGKAALYALGVTGADIGICARKDDDDVDMSLRRRVGVEVDLNTLLRRITARIGGSGGGHEGAAGASIPAEHFDTFLDTFKKEVSPVMSGEI